MEANNKELAISFSMKLIEAEALKLGMDAFFRAHVYTFNSPKEGQDVRSFAKSVTRELPDYCSFDAFFTAFRGRFVAWIETGNADGWAEE